MSHVVRVVVLNVTDDSKYDLKHSKWRHCLIFICKLEELSKTVLLITEGHILQSKKRKKTFGLKSGLNDIHDHVAHN